MAPYHCKLFVFGLILLFHCFLFRLKKSIIMIIIFSVFTFNSISQQQQKKLFKKNQFRDWCFVKKKNKLILIKKDISGVYLQKIIGKEKEKKYIDDQIKSINFHFFFLWNFFGHSFKSLVLLFFSFTFSDYFCFCFCFFYISSEQNYCGQK